MAHHIVRTVTTRWDAESVLAYLLDFTSAEEWDAGTVRCTLMSGDGGVGTTYRNVSKFLGRETTLDYEVESVSPGHEFVITGRNKTVTSRDTISVRATSAGTEVVYGAEMTFHGLAAIASPLLTPFLKRLGDQTQIKLRRTLDAKAGRSAE
ncbi:MAG: SRPBCC family protein [Actinomycetota bacterium]|nr:SRPBCC family protein [Actinomycetota bacterium]